MNWKECALCQQDDKNLIDPSKNKDPASCGYSKLATNIDAFTQNSLPLPAKLTVGIDDLAGSSDVATNLRDNGAKWHKGCAIELLLSKVQRALNCREKGNVNVEVETPSKKTRTSVSAKSPLGSNTCLFCDLPGTLSEKDPLCPTNKLTEEMKSKQLHRVTSFNRDSNIREAATVLGDTKLLVKLAEGDLIAQEACYHKKCMTDFTNRYRSYTAVDNIDHNTSSRTATDSWHGTTISATQHVDSAHDDIQRPPLNLKKSTGKSIHQLPRAYATVHPFILKSSDVFIPRKIQLNGPENVCVIIILLLSSIMLL